MLKKFGSGEAGLGLPSDVFTYKSGQVPLWVGRGFEYYCHVLRVECAVLEQRYYGNGKPSYVTKNKRLLITMLVPCAGSSRQQHVDILTGLVDLIAVENGKDCVIAGGDSRLRKLLKPTRRERK